MNLYTFLTYGYTFMPNAIVDKIAPLVSTWVGAVLIELSNADKISDTFAWSNNSKSMSWVRTFPWQKPMTVNITAVTNANRIFSILTHWTEQPKMRRNRFFFILEKATFEIFFEDKSSSLPKMHKTEQNKLLQYFENRPYL